MAKYLVTFKDFDPIHEDYRPRQQTIEADDYWINDRFVTFVNWVGDPLDGNPDKLCSIVDVMVVALIRPSDDGGN